MRAIIFLGLITIAESIGSQTGYNVTDYTGTIVSVLLVVGVMDILEFAKKITE